MMRAGAEDLRDVGPLGQAVALAFRFVFGAVCVIAAGWFVSNVRQIPADSQAVVMRLGSVVRTSGPGLLIALPRPLERIVVIPSAARQMPLKIARFATDPDAAQMTGEANSLSRDPRRNAGFLLTGDSNLVHLDAQLFYQVDDPVAYMVAAAHVQPALQRLFIASAIATIGRRDLDSTLVARPELAARASEAASRERLRADLVAAVNQRLAALTAAGAGLGVHVSRVDLVPQIPGGAKSAFDNVLVVSQNAQTAIANAQTTAQQTGSDAASKKDKITTSAAATAQETVTNARTATASIAALGQNAQTMSRAMLMTRLYYDRIQAILRKAGRVEVVDRKGVHTIMPAGPVASRPGSP
jgi:regulator of protease activity HflC (stomatin/prohibitin superfamily)